MAKDDVITLQGVVVQVYPNTLFKVRLENGHEIEATISGKMRVKYIKVIEGDKVTVEISPYDLNRGRIVWRNK